VFRYIAAKRWPGWLNPDGSPCLTRYLQHGRGTIGRARRVVTRSQQQLGRIAG
jgi:hypothetical protein